jgi:undecaprenyl-diphosphatase
VVLFGLFLSLTGLDLRLRSVAVVGWTMLLFGLLLYWADRRGAHRLGLAEWNMRHALVMGLWQAVALIPGTSRSGITITAARWLGYAREEAARIAMLMSIPTILASGLLLGAEVVRDADAALARDAAIAAAFAFVAALLALWGMMRLLRFASFTPYVIYRVLLGLVLLAVAYG